MTIVGDPLKIEVVDAAWRRPLYVVSDLHLCAGIREGRYTGTENFFADEAFGRWLAWVSTQHADTPALLMNGDVFDFLRFVQTPLESEYGPWLTLLQRLGCDSTATPTTVEHIGHGISRSERDLGLDDREWTTVWKLYEIRSGHPAFFTALAEWVKGGREVFVTQGNHDIEWYWKGVRACFLVVIAEEMLGMRGKARDGTDAEWATLKSAATALQSKVLFAGQRWVFGGTVHIEHGNRFDEYAKLPMAFDAYCPDAFGRLPRPLGSEFNYYLINQLELAYPYLDNVRPQDAIFPLLIRERFPLALRLVFIDVPRLASRLFRHPAYLFRWLILVVAIAGPAVLFVMLSFHDFATRTPGHGFGDWITSLLGAPLQNAGLLLVSYGLARLMGYLGLTQPDSLNVNARETLQADEKLDSSIRLVTFGHTHDPDTVTLNSHGVTRTYFNTGTWIPIVEIASADVRDDRAYTFLQITFAPDGEPTGILCRWNDDASRADPIPIIQRTGAV